MRKFVFFVILMLLQVSAYGLILPAVPDHGVLPGLDNDHHSIYWADTTIGTRATNYATTGTLDSNVHKITANGPTNSTFIKLVESGASKEAYIRLSTGGGLGLVSRDGNILLTPASGSDVYVNTAGSDFVFNAAETGTIGKVSSLRPLNVYVKNDIFAGNDITAGQDVIAGNTFIAPAGSVGAPTYTFVDNLTTGLYLSGDDNLGFTAGGVGGVYISGTTLSVSEGLNLRISEGGNLNIINGGTINIGDLVIGDGTIVDAGGIAFSTTDFTGVGTIGSGAITSTGTSSFDSPTLVVNSATNRVGIGTNSPDRELEVYGVGPIIRIRSAEDIGQAAAYVEFGRTTDGWVRTGFVGDGISSNEDIYLVAEENDLKLGDSSSNAVLTLSGGDATFSGSVQGVSITDGTFTATGGNFTSVGAIGCASLTATGALADGASSTFVSGATIGNLTLADGSITDSGGAISFNDEDLSTTGDLNIGTGGTVLDVDSTLGTVGIGVAAGEGALLNVTNADVRVSDNFSFIFGTGGVTIDTADKELALLDYRGTFNNDGGVDVTSIGGINIRVNFRQSGLDSATVTNAYGIRIQGTDAGGGAKVGTYTIPSYDHLTILASNWSTNVDIGVQTGIRIADMAADPSSVTTAWSIYSDGGDFFHKGDIAFGQTDKAERVGSDADGTLDLYAGTSIELHDATNIGDGTNEMQVSGTGDVSFVGTAGLGYGGMFLHSGGVTIDCVGGNFIKITGLGSVGLLNNVTYSTSALRVDKVGVYLVNYSGDADAAAINKEFEFAVHLNNVEIQQGSDRKHSTPTAHDEFHFSGTCLIDVTNTAHDIDLRVKNLTDDTDIDILDVAFNIIQVGGT